MALYTVQIASVISPNDVNQFTNLLNGTTTGVQITNSGRIRAQLTGAAAGAGGYVGQINGGPPVSGAFVTGDFMIDGTLGVIWTCIASGSPGTWVTAGPGLISSQTLSSSTASITFSSLPAFSHFTIRWHARGDAATVTQNMNMQVNGVTSSSYLSQFVDANNTTVAGNLSLTANLLIGTLPGTSSNANYFGAGIVEINGAQDANYTPIVATSVNLGNSATGIAGVFGGATTGIGPVTSVKLYPASGNFVSGSRFSIYGWM
jgi:hypothetical protein